MNSQLRLNKVTLCLRISALIVKTNVLFMVYLVPFFFFVFFVVDFVV